MKKILLALIMMCGSVIADYEHLQLGNNINGNNFSQFGYSTSLSADGSTLAVGARLEGKVYVYKYVCFKICVF